jgi:hypothetical protein
MKKKSALALIECEKIDSMSSSTDKGADQSDRFHHAPDLGDVPSDGLIGNTPLLMAFQHFASGGEDNVDVYTSWGDKHIHIRIESHPKHGPATQFDKRLLQYAMSQAVANREADGTVPQSVNIKISDFIAKCDRSSSGQYYHLVRDAAERLQGTRVFTNIETSQEGYDRYFNWIYEVSTEYVDRTMADKTVIRGVRSITFKLCDWIHRLLNDVDSDLILYDPGYLEMRSSLGQRIYEVAHSHTCNSIFKISIEKLMAQVGFTGETKTFKKNLKQMGEKPFEAEGDHRGTMEILPIPQHALYAFSAKKPEHSVPWGERVMAKNQYIVFVRGEPQWEYLVLNLKEIPEWDPQFSITAL